MFLKKKVLKMPLNLMVDFLYFGHLRIQQAMLFNGDAFQYPIQPGSSLTEIAEFVLEDPSPAVDVNLRLALGLAVLAVAEPMGLHDVKPSNALAAADVRGIEEMKLYHDALMQRSIPKAVSAFEMVLRNTQTIEGRRKSMVLKKKMLLFLKLEK